MPRKSISQLSGQMMALIILSKFLYGIVDSSIDAEKLILLHKQYISKLLSEATVSAIFQTYDDISHIQELPWHSILHSMSISHPLIREFQHSGIYTPQEIGYICAMMCGLNSRDYGLITGYKSHYNLSLSIRRKLKMPHRSTNLRNFLQNVAKCTAHESAPVCAPK